jgi:cyclase
MNRRTFLHQSALTFGALTLTQQSILSCTSGPKSDTWKITMLRNDIGIFEENGGTVAFLLSPNETVVVDAQYPKPATNLINELKKRSPRPVRLLINTHHHVDHTAGNISFKGVAEQILAHTNSKKNQQNWARAQQLEDKQLYPDQVYSDNWSGQFGNEKISVDYLGVAHTDGDSLIHFQHANIVHAGDIVFNRHQPNVDRSAGSNIKSWMQVLDKAVQKYDKSTLYIFGHADNGFKLTGSSDDLLKFRDFLGNLLKFVEKEIRAGKTKEEILKATIIPGGEEWGGDRIELGLEGAYEELTAG